MDSTFQKISRVSLRIGDLYGLVFPTNNSPSTSFHSSFLPMKSPLQILFPSSTGHTPLTRLCFAIRLSHRLFNSILQHTYLNCSTGPPMHSRTLHSSSLGISSNTFSTDAIPGKLQVNHQKSLLSSGPPAGTLEVPLFMAYATRPIYPSSFSFQRAGYHRSRKLR